MKRLLWGIAFGAIVCAPAVAQVKPLGEGAARDDFEAVCEPLFNQTVNVPAETVRLLSNKLAYVTKPRGPGYEENHSDPSLPTPDEVKFLKVQRDAKRCYRDGYLAFYAKYYPAMVAATRTLNEKQEAADTALIDGKISFAEFNARWLAAGEEYARNPDIYWPKGINQGKPPGK